MEGNAGGERRVRGSPASPHWHRPRFSPSASRSWPARGRPRQPPRSGPLGPLQPSWLVRWPALAHHLDPREEALRAADRLRDRGQRRSDAHLSYRGEGPSGPVRPLRASLAPVHARPRLRGLGSCHRAPAQNAAPSSRCSARLLGCRDESRRRSDGEGEGPTRRALACPRWDAGGSRRSPHHGACSRQIPRGSRRCTRRARLPVASMTGMAIELVVDLESDQVGKA